MEIRTAEVRLVLHPIGSSSVSEFAEPRLFRSDNATPSGADSLPAVVANTPYENYPGGGNVFTHVLFVAVHLWLVLRATDALVWCCSVKLHASPGGVREQVESTCAGSF